MVRDNCVRYSYQKLENPPPGIHPCNNVEQPSRNLLILKADGVFGNDTAEATGYFEKTLKRTPNRSKAILGLARAARVLGDDKTAMTRYEEFLSVWKAADPGRPELAEARPFLQGPHQ